MGQTQISVAEAKPDKLFYVVANLIIIKPDEQSCLLLKRGDNEKVHPGKWAFPGGKLEHGDVSQILETENTSPIEGVDNILGRLAEREAKEECGLDVDARSARLIANKIFIRPDGIPVLLVMLAATYTDGEVVLEDRAISDHAWVKLDQFDQYDHIPGLREEAELALS